MSEIVRTSSTPTVGVIMPVYNEELWLDVILERVLTRPEVAQIVAVDDGSSDGSWRKLEQWNKKEQRLQIIRHDKNRGKGAAIKTGLKEIRAPLVLIQDADLEYSPNDYPKLLEPILRDNADVVYGSRFLAGRTGNPRWHTFGNRAITWLLNRMTGLHLSDGFTCYKLFRHNLLKEMELHEKGFGICFEITTKLARQVKQGRLRIVEIPITYHGRTRADGKKIRFVRDGIDALKCIWKYS